MTPIESFLGGFAIGFVVAGALFYRLKVAFDSERVKLNQEINKAWNPGDRG